jgi:hypothetical protein
MSVSDMNGARGDLDGSGPLAGLGGFELIGNLLAILRDPEAVQTNLTQLRNSLAIFLATKAEAEAAQKALDEREADLERREAQVRAQFEREAGELSKRAVKVFNSERALDERHKRLAELYPRERAGVGICLDKPDDRQRLYNPGRYAPETAAAAARADGLIRDQEDRVFDPDRRFVEERSEAEDRDEPSLEANFSGRSQEEQEAAAEIIAGVDPGFALTAPVGSTLTREEPVKVSVRRGRPPKAAAT